MASGVLWLKLHHLLEQSNLEAQESPFRIEQYQDRFRSLWNATEILPKWFGRIMLPRAVSRIPDAFLASIWIWIRIRSARVPAANLSFLSEKAQFGYFYIKNIMPTTWSSFYTKSEFGSQLTPANLPLLIRLKQAKFKPHSKLASRPFQMIHMIQSVFFSCIYYRGKST
jgi:hypothetical protein